MVCCPSRYGKLGSSVVFAAGLALIGGCGDSAAPDEGIPGAYPLRTIAGQDLPFAIVDFGDGDKEEITGGGIELLVDDTFGQTINSTSTVDGAPESVTSFRSGSYIVTGSNIELTFESGEIVSGTVDGITLTLDIERIPWVFRK